MIVVQRQRECGQCDVAEHPGAVMNNAIGEKTANCEALSGFCKGFWGVVRAKKRKKRMAWIIKEGIGKHQFCAFLRLVFWVFFHNIYSIYRQKSLDVVFLFFKKRYKNLAFHPQKSYGFYFFKGRPLQRPP